MTGWLQRLGAAAAACSAAVGMRRRGKGPRGRAAAGSGLRGTGNGVRCGADEGMIQTSALNLCCCRPQPTSIPLHTYRSPNPPSAPPGTAVLQITLRAAGVPPLNDDLVPILTGGCPELGDWDPAHGVQLTLEPGGGVWGARLAARLAGGGVAAKLVLCRRGDRTPVVWEPGSDRVIGPAGANKLVLCGMTWGEQAQGEAKGAGRKWRLRVAGGVVCWVLRACAGLEGKGTGIRLARSGR